MDQWEKAVAKLVKHIQRVRKKRKISVYRIAQDTGLSHTGIHHMEKGRATPTLYFLLRICDYLEVDIAKILEAIKAGKRPKL